MKRDIILAGVGGQGILSIATVIGYIAVKKDMYLKQAEVHGMSQRGGNVSSHLRISDKPIASDQVPMGKADMIMSIEPMESLRYLPWLGQKGWIVTNSAPFVNIPNYPEIETIYEEIKKFDNHVLFDAGQLAKDAGNVRSANMVVLGAAAPFLGFEKSDFHDAISFIFGRKGAQMVEVNIKAFDTGWEQASHKIVVS